MPYSKQTFIDGQVLTAAHLNHIEEGIVQLIPVKGVDYFTPADQEAIVQQVIAALGTPVFGRVADNGDIILTGNLANGEYTIKYENADGSLINIGTLSFTEAAYINLADPTSAEWLTDFRLSTSSTSTLTGAVTTNYIPCKYGDTIYIKGLDVATVPGGNARFHVADANKALLIENGVQVDVGYLKGLIDNGLASRTGDVYAIPAGKSSTSSSSLLANIAYQRFCGTLMTGYAADDVIITVNEPIISENGYTNLFDPDTAQINMRLNSSNVEKVQNGTVLTDYISLGDVMISGEENILRCKGMRFDQAGVTDLVTYIHYYDADKTFLGYTSYENISYIKDENGNPYFVLDAQYVSARYVRVTGLVYDDGRTITQDDITDIVITLNERITDGATYTNLADTSAEAGWLNDKRFSTSSNNGTIKDSTSGGVITNFIQVRNNQTLRAKGLNFVDNIGDVIPAVGRYSAKDTFVSLTYFDTANGAVYDSTTNISTINTKSLVHDGEYIRICGTLVDGYTADDIIITLDEEIPV